MVNGNGWIKWALGAVLAVTMALLSAISGYQVRHNEMVDETTREHCGRISALEANFESQNEQLGRIETKLDELLIR